MKKLSFFKKKKTEDSPIEQSQMEQPQLTDDKGYSLMDFLDIMDKKLDDIPVEDLSALHTKPETEKAIAEEPAVEEAATEEAAQEEAAVEEPAAEEAAAEVAAAEEPAVEEAAVEEAVAEVAAAEEPAVEEAAVEEAMAEEAMAEETAVEEAAQEEAAAEEPAAEVAAVEEAAAEVAAAEEAAAEVAAAEEAAAEEAAQEEAAAEEAMAEEAAAEEAAVEEAMAEEAAVEERVLEEPEADELILEEPLAEESVLEENIPEEPMTGEPADTVSRETEILDVAVEDVPDEEIPVNTEKETEESGTEDGGVLTDADEDTPEIRALEESIEDLPDEVSEGTQEEVPEEPETTDAESADTEETETASAEAPENEAAAEKKPEEPVYKKLGLYIHIPFCVSKCAYCDFYSTDKVLCQKHSLLSHAPAEMTDYVTALKNHMHMMGERCTQYNIDTVFIGGGTPTALPPQLLLDIVKEVKRDFYTDDNLEFTVEMNPATADKQYLHKLRAAGVNRLSIGLQSALNHELAALSRIHTVGDFAEAFQDAREAGFDNINIDVMYGIPEQTVGSFMETLSFVCGMKPEHISMYNLRIEDGTPFAEKRNLLPLPDEDAECEMYFGGIKYLREQGYAQYEISNFSKEGKECRHNLRYWRGEEYIGFGAAAHSYFGGRRFSFRRAMTMYSQTFSRQLRAIPKSLLDENYVIDRKEYVAEYMMLRLRLTEGIDLADFRERFGADFDEAFGKKLQVYVDNGFMHRFDGRIAFTPKGMFVSNYILARIIPFEPRFNNTPAK